MKRSHSSNHTHAGKTSGERAAPVSRREAATGQAAPIRGRKWAFRIASLVLLPGFLLGALEFALRLSDYGFDPSFFKAQRIGGESYLVENDKFGLRFFPAELARSPSPVVMKTDKETGTYRIFVLGESAALGDPRPAYGAPRYLEVLLRERFPEAKFEVVCVAMTAINSHALREIARECARYEGDVWILYLGNNEMIGPFGATGVFGPKAPPIVVVRASLALQRLRSGQLLLALVRKLGAGKSAPPLGWGGMEMWVKNRLTPGDPARGAVHKHFAGNLRDILRASRNSEPDGAKLVLSTMAVNLRDCPPLATLSSRSLPSPAQQEFSRLLRSAEQNAAETNYAAATVSLLSAARLDPERADLEFRIGTYSLAASNHTQALEHFTAARDLDALPFRADSQLNEEIIRAGREWQPEFFDAQQTLSSNSVGRIAGQELFYEHVHLNFLGNYLLARAWAERVEKLLSPQLRDSASAEWGSQELCEHRLGLTDWNRAGVLEDVLFRLSQPPLSTQANNPARVQAFRAQLKELREGMTLQAMTRGRELFREALARAPRDHRLHANHAEFLEATGDLDQAIASWRLVSELLPHHHVSYFQTGRLLARRGRLADAEKALRQALLLRPDLVEGWLELGKIALAEKRVAESLEHLEKARELLPQDPRVYYYKGRALATLERREEAIQSYRQAVNLNTNYWEAQYSLGEELAFAGQEAEACAHFVQVLRLKPDHTMAHLNLGVALVKAGQLETAAKEFQETLRLDPQNARALNYLQQLQERGVLAK